MADDKKTPREQTIDTENEVDEASFESFPASDPPAFAGGDSSIDAEAMKEKEKEAAERKSRNT
ncbi:hypothetical protein BH23ACT11_BH23ACT11_17600 [soil metagenome]